MNQADKMILFASGVFLLAILGVIRFPENVWGQCLLFVSEAALVGGIADWFAVKALFERPLGIPWHTALLPNSRPQFTNAAIDLIQYQFFSKKNIMKKIQKINFVSEGIRFIQPKHKEFFTEQILSFLQENVEKWDVVELSHQWGEKYTPLLCDMVRKEIQKNAIVFLTKEKFHEKLLLFLINWSRKKIEGEYGVLFIRSFLEKIEKEESEKGGISNYKIWLGKFTGVLNIEEGAMMLQSRLLLILNELSETNSETYRALSLTLQKSLENFISHQEWNALLNAIFAEVTRREVVGKCLIVALTNIKKRLQIAMDKKDEDELYVLLHNIIRSEIDKALENLRSNAEARKKIDKFIVDVAIRSALQAQNMIADVVKTAMNSLSDKQLNTMVYSKVEMDLIWIRLNGSIVGGLIGFVLFWFIEGMKWAK